MEGPRFYRRGMAGERFTGFTASHRDTDVWVGVDPGSHSPRMPEACERHIRRLRSLLDHHIGRCPEFRTSLEPVLVPDGAPDIAREMARAGRRAGVGPMAAVAGAFAQEIGRMLMRDFRAGEVVVENGGDIFMMVQTPLVISIYAGTSPLSGRIGLEITDTHESVGFCTSSGTVGPSHSFGKADAFGVACRDAALADACATAYCNGVQSAADIPSLLEQARAEGAVLSAVVIAGDGFGVTGRYPLRLIGDDCRRAMKGG